MRPLGLMWNVLLPEQELEPLISGLEWSPAFAKWLNRPDKIAFNPTISVLRINNEYALTRIDQRAQIVMAECEKHAGLAKNIKLRMAHSKDSMPGHIKKQSPNSAICLAIFELYGEFKNSEYWVALQSGHSLDLSF